MAQRAQFVPQRSGDSALVIAPASVSEYARGALVRTADAALANVVAGALTKRGGPSQGDAAAEPMAEMQRESAGSATGPSGPVMLRPWGEKSTVTRPSGQPNPPALPTAPSVDTAFVF